MSNVQAVQHVYTNWPFAKDITPNKLYRVEDTCGPVLYIRDDSGCMINVRVGVPCGHLGNCDTWEYH